MGNRDSVERIKQGLSDCLSFADEANKRSKMKIYEEKRETVKAAASHTQRIKSVYGPRKTASVISSNEFTSETKKVPHYYNRAGPGSYDGGNIEVLSNKQSSRGFMIKQETVPPAYQTIEPTTRSSQMDKSSVGHRFKDFERSKVCVEIIEETQRRTKQMSLTKSLIHPTILEHKKLELLMPECK